MSEKYDDYQKKYGLIPAKDIEKEFGFDPKKSKPKEIAEKIISTLSENAKLLENLIFVDSGSPASHLYQASMLRQKDIDVFETYKNMMSMLWQGKRIVLENNEQKMVDYINKTTLKWKKIKVELLNVFELFEKEWPQVALRDTDDVAYHG
ncbi:MAG: hypothetical protein N3D75_03375 [Candidatus Aenigmarchaeota archaeon]|nr:hypothetical protein [Candidatus Aenigmarchaeota archaeon]